MTPLFFFSFFFLRIYLHRMAPVFSPRQTHIFGYNSLIANKPPTKVSFKDIIYQSFSWRESRVLYDYVINSVYGQKAQKFIHFGPYDLIQITPVCSSNTYQIMYGETADIRCQHLQWSHRRVLMPNLLQKADFPIGHFALPLLTLEV